MNWEAIAAIGQVIGAIAIVIALLLLVMQVKRNTQSVAESNRLRRAETVDRHAQSISRWRGRLIENPHLSRIWIAACDGQSLSDEDSFYLDNLWVDFVNTQRSNFVRSAVVNESGMARQAVMSVAVEIYNSSTFEDLWAMSRHWHEIASPDYVTEVEKQLALLREGGQSKLRPANMSNHVGGRPSAEKVKTVAYKVDKQKAEEQIRKQTDSAEETGHE